MFKLESYITPIILSQVERYVKNIRAEDSQVSLWGGDAVFNNLDLRLDVLEQELRLPFSLVSGHIHELQIHVPWTRLHTEPIVLTINTIECVLKLPGDRAASVSSTGSQEGSKAEEKKRNKRVKDEQNAPPGYIQGLINKIISNIQIVCNNLILKYVEDDLVLSLNVRTASFSSCNESWEPAFTELSLPDLILRKVLSVSDLTICLDRRGAMGKIEVYQDPLLYRCSLTVRVGWCYQSLTAKVPFRTVINTLADQMDFSMTGVQVPMVVRLAKLFLAFYYGEIGTQQVQERRKSKNQEMETTEVVHKDINEDEASLGGLLWDVGTSLGTALLPVYWEDEENPSPQNLPPMKMSSQLGWYIKETSLTLKLAANVKQKGFYRSGKQCFNSYLLCKMQGIYAEVSSKGSNWVSVQAGVSEVIVSPVGAPADTLQNYVLAGGEGKRFLEKSLFAPEYGEEQGTKPKELEDTEDGNWDIHIETVTETSLLEKTPAFAMDYVYNLDIPSDIGSEDLSEIVGDLENSNLPERALCRFVIGPSAVHVSEEAVSRVNTVLDLVNNYDYVSYTTEKHQPGPEGLTLPTKEEIDNLENNNPVRVYRLTLLHPTITLHSKGCRLEAGVRCADIVHQVPMYPLRNVQAGSVMHPPSRTILNNCHSTVSVTVMDTWVKLNVEKSVYRLLVVDKASFSYRILLFKQFWKNLYQKHGDFSLKFDSVQINSSGPQLTLSMRLLEKMFQCRKIELQEPLNDCNGKQHPAVSSLFTGVDLSWTWTREIYTIGVGVDSASVSIKSNERGKSVPIFTGICQIPPKSTKLVDVGHSPGKAFPDKVKSGWLKFAVQWPSGSLTHTVPTLIHLDLGQTFLLADPKLAEIFRYACLRYYETNGNTVHPDTNIVPKESPDSGVSEVSVLQCLSGTIVNARCGSVSLYLPDKTLPSISGQTVLEVVTKAGKAKPSLSLVKICLASGDIHNASVSVDLGQYTHHPVLFPPTVWTAGKDNFPWSISLKGFSVEAVENSCVNNFLQPVTTTSTFGVGSDMAICIHADMTPLQFLVDNQTLTSLTKVSQCLLSSLLHLFPAPEDTGESNIKVKTEETTGPALIQRSLGSVSESTTQVTSGFHSQSLKNKTYPDSGYSLWLQWAVPQCSWTLIAGPKDHRTKFTFLFEDSSVSIDQQEAYTKLKFRIRSLTGSHCVENEFHDFVPGNFPGRTISCQPDLLKTIYAYSPEKAAVETLSDDDDVPLNCLSKGIFNMTITKAECQNVAKKLKSSKEKGKKVDDLSQSKRFITEFDFEINPLDIFLDSTLIPSLISLFYPLTNLKMPSKPGVSKPFTHSLLQFNNNNLPMVYLKSERLRVFIQIPRDNLKQNISNISSNDLVPDFILLQMKKASITSQVENPLTRILVDVPLYHQASTSRLLGVPGSEIEDRQYQVDLKGVTLATGHWQDMVEKNRKPEKSLLRTMSENPALEWNTNREMMEEANDVVMVPIIYDFSLKLMIAPAIVYRKCDPGLSSETLVAGISAELNAVTDLNLCMSLQQISFLSSLKEEIDPFLKKAPMAESESSGVDCKEHTDPDSKSIKTIEIFEIPIEVLLTCNNVRLGVHKFEKSNASITADDVKMWRRYHHAGRKIINERRISMDSDVTEIEEREREERNVLTDPVPPLEYESTEVGYEGSEEESCFEQKNKVNIRLIPLFSVMVTHPHIFLSLSPTEQKVDLSIYNLLLACSPEGFHLPANSGKKIPWQRDFPTILLETRPGKPDSKSGIPPALLTLTLSNILSQSMVLNCKFERPVLVSVSKERVNQVCKILDHFREYNRKEDVTENIQDQIPQKFLIKEVKVVTTQIMCLYESKEKEMTCSMKAAFGGSTTSIEIVNSKNREQIGFNCDFERLAVSLTLGEYSHSLLDPFTLGVAFKKTLNDGPSLSDCYMKLNFGQCYIHVGPNHLYALEAVMESLKHLKTEADVSNHDEGIAVSNRDIVIENELDDYSDSDQHYLDDLRAGAFLYLDAVVKGDKLDPAPYQVVFDKTTLTWRYPQSRTLSKVVIFPVPFMEASEFSFDSTNENVDCDLLYWSETIQSFVVYQNFQLSESAVIHLDLPVIRDRKTCSSSHTWQVRLNRLTDQAFITPQALISVLKVDSYSSPKLLPDSQISASFSSLKILLHNHLHFAGKKLTNEFEDLAIDDHFPQDQAVFKFSLSPLDLGASIWPEDKSSQLIQCSMKTKLSLEFVDYTFLGMHSLLQPADMAVLVQYYQGQVDTAVKVGYLDLTVGPFFMHTMRQSVKLWKQVTERLQLGATSEPAVFIPLCQMLVVNETGQIIRFGQSDTDENILLQPKYSSMYAWRSNKASQKLNVSIESKNWEWSKPFPLVQGVNMVQMSSEGSEKNLSMIVYIEKKSSNLCIVKFCGMLNILNLLREHIELRILTKNAKEIRCLIGSYCRPTSVVTKCEESVVKIRFFGLGTPWSGDIPLEAAVGKRKSFMIKLPLKDKGSSTTVWCTILTEVLDGELRKMLIFSPMYVINSQLPGVITSSITCSENDVQSELTVQGFGHTEQMDITGAPENKFSMSFRLSPDLPLSSPPLNVSWGIIDQVREKNGKLLSIDEVIRTSHRYNLRTNKQEGFLKEISNLKVSEKPKTDCKVTFGQYHPVTNTLCVKVKPDFLIINKTDLPILTKQTGSSSWMIEPSSIFHPPPMTDKKFFFGLQEPGGVESWGSALELSDHEWTYLTIRPSVQGVIHLHENVMYNLSPHKNVMSFVTLSSDICDGIRTLVIKPYFVFSNQTKNLVNTYAEVSYEKKKKNIEDEEDSRVGLIRTASNEIKPLSFWSLKKDGDGQLLHSVYLSYDDQHWSPPVSVVQEDDSRHCLTIPTPEGCDGNTPVIAMTHRAEGQVFIIVKEDSRPQAKVHNGLAVAVVFREENSARIDQIKNHQSLFLTMPWLSQGFPFIEQNKQSRKLQFSLENNAWSTGIDITITQETFINLPGHGDIRITVECLQPTIQVYLEPVSNLEVAARDIRARFGEPCLQDTVYLTPNSSFVTVGSPEPEVYSECLPDELITDDPAGSPVHSSRRHSIASSFSVISKPSGQSTGHFLSVKVKELSMALSDDLKFNDDFQEILRMTIFNLDLECKPKMDYSTVYKTLGGQHSQEMEIDFKIGDLQLDNQMFKRGLYHFPVILSSKCVDKEKVEAKSKLIEANTSLEEASGAYYSKTVFLKLRPLVLNLEDTFIYKIQEYMNMLLMSEDDIAPFENSKDNNELVLPPNVVFASESMSQMVFMKNIIIEAVDLQVSAHASVKVFVGLEESQISLSKFENTAVWTTWYSLGHRLSMHYLSGALFKAGWVVGSLDMIGSPAAFTRTVTDGVKDFVSLPYNGIWNGPWGFLVGLSLGSSSLVKHVSAGSLTSITNFASSMSRNLDRLSFDTEHLIRNEEVRRLKPQGLGEGLINGLSGVGISLLGAIGGLAHHPIQVLLEDGVSPVKLMGGVGRGMVGVVTKPLGSAAELIAQTGHGMLTGSGWSRTRRPRLSSVPSLVFDLSSSQLKYQWKILFSDAACVVDASLFEDNQYTAVSVVLSKNAVHIISEDEDETKNVHNIDEVNLVETAADPTLLVLELSNSDNNKRYEHVNDRVARFVLESISFTEQGMDPDLQTPLLADSATNKVLLYMSPHTRQEFCTIFSQLKEENMKIGFPVLF